MILKMNTSKYLMVMEFYLHYVSVTNKLNCSCPAFKFGDAFQKRDVL